jgi:hypothetical protein
MGLAISRNKAARLSLLVLMTMVLAITAWANTVFTITCSDGRSHSKTCTLANAQCTSYCDCSTNPCSAWFECINCNE